MVPQIIQHSATPDQVAFISRAVRAYRTDDIFYQKKQKADPWIEAISIDFLRVDFGGGVAAATEYVDWLNSVYDQTLLTLRVKEVTYEPIDI